MTNLPEADSRHGTNGYSNLNCRCDKCRAAGTEWHASKYTKVDIAGPIDATKDFHARFKAYAKRKGESMRQIGLRAVAEYMERNP